MYTLYCSAYTHTKKTNIYGTALLSEIQIKLPDLFSLHGPGEGCKPQQIRKNIGNIWEAYRPQLEEIVLLPLLASQYLGYFSYESGSNPLTLVDVNCLIPQEVVQSFLNVKLNVCRIFIFIVRIYMPPFKIKTLLWWYVLTPYCRFLRNAVRFVGLFLCAMGLFRNHLRQHFRM